MMNDYFLLINDFSTYTLTNTSRSKVAMGINIRPNQNTGVVNII